MMEQERAMAELTAAVAAQDKKVKEVAHEISELAASLGIHKTQRSMDAKAIAELGADFHRIAEAVLGDIHEGEASAADVIKYVKEREEVHNHDRERAVTLEATATELRKTRDKQTRDIEHLMERITSFHSGWVPVSLSPSEGDAKWLQEFDKMSDELRRQRARRLEMRDVRDRLTVEVGRHQADLAAAAGELLVVVPRPGTSMAKVVRANRLLVAEVGRLRADLSDASKAGTPYYRERDAMNALTVRNSEMEAVLRASVQDCDPPADYDRCTMVGQGVCPTEAACQLLTQKHSANPSTS